MKGYVYSITSPSNKVYVGITLTTPKNRFREHIAFSKRGNSNRKISNAFRKYGPDNLKLSTLEILEHDVKEELYKALCEREKFHIHNLDTFINGYNCTLGGEGTVGMVGELNPFYGKKHNPETVAKFKEMAKLRRHTPESRKKLSEAGKGRKHKAESIQKMKEVQRKRSKRVICLDNQIIYPSLTNCSEQLKITRSDIRKVCEGKRITAHGMKFRYVIDGVIQEVQEPENKRIKRIKCVQTNKTYDSITECCADLGVRHQHVSAILRGRQKTTKGYSFIYD